MVINDKCKTLREGITFLALQKIETRIPTSTIIISLKLKLKCNGIWIGLLESTSIWNIENDMNLFIEITVKSFFDLNSIFVQTNNSVFTCRFPNTSMQCSKLWPFWSPWWVKKYLATEILTKVANWRPTDYKRNLLEN